MKYGVISYEKKLLKLDGKDAQNIGDWLQMFAMEYLLNEWGIKNVIHVSRNDAAEYSGEECFAVVNGFNTCNDAPHISTKTFPLSDKIIPLFWSFHFHDRYIPRPLKEQLLLYAPIGCRDEETMQNLRNQGIPAFITGCVSALLPKRSADVAASAKKVIFVDIPQSLIPYIPAKIKTEAEILSNVYPITRTTGEHVMTKKESTMSCEFAANRYRHYYFNAKLIVTSRLHVAAPAVAMGIPCILVSDNFDGRYSWLDKFLPLYTPDMYEEIDWNPRTIEYEEEKESIKNSLKKILLDKVDKTEELRKISTFFENRTKGKYNAAFEKALSQYVTLPENTKYAIWGTVTGKSNQLKYCIEKCYPHWNFVGIYDKFAKGNFEGHTILSSVKLEDKKDVIYFIMSSAIYKEAKEKIKCGKYVLVDVSKEKFEGNV